VAMEQHEVAEIDREKWSGRVDLNHRPPGPEPGALARLSHAPTVYVILQQFTLDSFERQLAPMPLILFLLADRSALMQNILSSVVQSQC
jgi:hypothetical protein